MAIANVFKKLATKHEISWQEIDEFRTELSKTSVTENEAAIKQYGGIIRFVVNLFRIIDRSHGLIMNTVDVSEPYTVQLAKTCMTHKDMMDFKNLLEFKNVSEATLDKLIDFVAVNNEYSYWGIPNAIITHPNFTLVLEKKIVGSVKKYHKFLNALADFTKDENHLVRIAKGLKDDSWEMRTVMKRRILSPASLEKLSKIAPQSLAVHSTKVLPEVLDKMVQNGNKDVCAAAVTNKNIRPETLRAIVENADPDKDEFVIRNVVFNKKAPVDVLATAFCKCGNSRWLLKEYMKNPAFVEYVRTKLKESK